MYIFKVRVKIFCQMFEALIHVTEMEYGTPH